MVKLRIADTKMLLLRSCWWRAQTRQYYNDAAPPSATSAVDANHNDHEQEPLRSKEIDGGKRESTSSWVPDGRTGIYVPKGHEWVMEDVPENAASFDQTHWFRNVDGVEKPDPDSPSHDHQISTHFYY